jgi:hypothetical protein
VLGVARSYPRFEPALAIVGVLYPSAFLIFGMALGRPVSSEGDSASPAAGAIPTVWRKGFRGHVASRLVDAAGPLT